MSSIYQGKKLLLNVGTEIPVLTKLYHVCYPNQNRIWQLAFCKKNSIEPEGTLGQHKETLKTLKKPKDLEETLKDSKEPYRNLRSLKEP